MSEFPKHEKAAPRKKPQPAQTAAATAKADVYVSGLSGIEESLDCLTQAVRRITSDETDFSLSTGHSTDPVKITLADNDHSDTMDRLVTALERIADAVAKVAGLNRPRLESWHEQCAYEPRYKDVACDGGAPGPAIAAALDANGE
jgi:hypothetical protein